MSKPYNIDKIINDWWDEEAKRLEEIYLTDNDMTEILDLAIEGSYECKI